MPPKKTRIAIPADVSAKILFDSDRTCCICHEKKPVQIHHIDDNPSHNSPDNLAVLCLECHHDTQLKGGFGRKLDAEQVRLYRADWLSQVRQRRLITTPEESLTRVEVSGDVRQVAARLEIFKSEEDWLHVARVYDEIHDIELRDKYIAMALKSNPDSFEVYRIARMQGTTTDLPDEFIDKVIQLIGADWTWRAAVLFETGRIMEAAKVYLKGIEQAIDEERWFSAGFYIRHALNDEIATALFMISLRRSAEKEDIWWQLRAFEELGCDDEKRELLLGNETKIMKSGEPHLVHQLAQAKGDHELALKAAKELAEIDIKESRMASEYRHNESEKESTDPTETHLP